MTLIFARETCQMSIKLLMQDIFIISKKLWTRSDLLGFVFLISLIMLSSTEVYAKAPVRSKRVSCDKYGNRNQSYVDVFNVSKYKSIDDIFELLQAGDKHLVLGETKDIILVLGNTGSGKTALTQFIAGDNSKLKAVEVASETGEYIIVDDKNKIGHGIYSKSVIPDRVFDTESKVTYYDSPGFSDTRNAAFDIASSYFLKKTVDYIKSVKIVLTISYSSLRAGVDRIDFLTLARHTNEFIKDMEKFKNSIVLVVTKVDKKYVTKKKKIVAVPYEKMIDEIAGYIRHTRSSFQRSLDSERNFEQQSFLKKAIFLIDIFLSKAQNKYQKIALFMRPDTGGALSKMPGFQNEKKYIKNIIKNAVFVKKTENDFGFSISDNSKISVLKLVDKINIRILFDLSKTAKRMENSFELQISNSDNIYVLKENIIMWIKELMKRHDELENCLTHREFVIKFNNLLNSTSDIENPRRIFLKILKQYKYMEFLEVVSYENFEVKPMEWTPPLRKILTYLNDLKIWYIFLNDLYEKMCYYKMHTYIFKKIFENKFKRHRNLSSSKIMQFLYSLKDYNVMYHENMYTVGLNDVKRRDLRNLFHSMYGNRVSFACSNNDTLMIKGGFVKFRDIDSKNPCPKKIKTVEILASNSVFIDADLIRKGEKLNVFVAAPRWEVIGKRHIVLDGVSALGTFPGAASEGEDGSPGLPGGTAGNFIGIGSKIINAEQLTISANGGDGGPGQDGGDGKQGVDGQAFLPKGSLAEGEKIMRQGRYSIGPLMKEALPDDFFRDMGFAIGDYHTDDRRYFIAFGTDGTRGGDGGMGGAGGIGGLKGNIFLYGLSGRANVLTLGQNGLDGKPGKGGSGAKGGAHPKEYVECYSTKTAKCLSGPKTLSRWIEVISHPRGRAPSGNTSNNITSANIKSPSTNPVIITSPVNDYKLYLLSHVNIKIDELYSDMDNDRNIETCYDSLGYFHELRNLENLYYNIHDGVNFQDIYESLMRRIEKYSFLPKPYEETLHHKKLLSFLYTAALSKALGLNKYNNNDFVLDVHSYLNDITDSMEQIKHLTRHAVMYELKHNYKRKIRGKMKEAENIIKNLVTRDVEGGRFQIGYAVEKLVGEIIRLQNRKEKNKIVEKQKELEDYMKQKGIVNLLKIFNIVTKCVCTLGRLTGAIIETTNNVIDSLLLDQDATDEISFSSVHEFQTMLDMEMAILEKVLGNKITALQHFLGTLLEETQKYSQELEFLRAVVTSLKSDAAEAHPGEINTSFSFMISITDKLATALTTKMYNVNTSYSIETNDVKSAKGSVLKDVSNSLETFLKTLKFVELFTDEYLTRKNDTAKLELISNAIAKQVLNVNKLRQYHRDIYRNVIPLFKMMRANFLNSTKRISSVSYSALNTFYGEVISSLKNLKVILRKITNGFKMHENLMRPADEIDETLTLLVRIFENLENYNKKKKLADYITDISSDQAHSIKTGNDTINDALNRLNLIVKSGIIIEQFRKGVASFKQYIFPFSKSYSKELNVILRMNFETNIEKLICQIDKRIENLHVQLIKHNSTIHKQFYSYVREDYFQGGGKFSAPFFVWDNDNYGDSISRLLSGEEVMLKSDIVNSVHEKNAIKFNKIEIKLTSAKRSVKVELEKGLTAFDVTMKHSGNSYYRCDNTFYLLTTDSQTLYYSFEKNKQGKPIRSNKVYKKITNGDYVLSPYTTWTIQLKPFKHSNVTIFNRFKRNVDLELVGYGQYITSKNTICGNHLQKIYETVDTMSVTDVLIEKS